jgi:hypothetical protein
MIKGFEASLLPVEATNAMLATRVGPHAQACVAREYTCCCIWTGIPFAIHEC